MASIVERNGKYKVVYNYTDERGKKKQKWETCQSLAEAKRRKTEIEYKKLQGKLVIPQCTVLEDLRRKNAELFEEAFYKKKNLNPDMNGQSNGGNSQKAPAHIVTVPETIDPVVLQKALLDPEMAALIKALAAGMEKAR